MTAKVCVIMAVRNGAAFLEQQLTSIRAQTLPPKWMVISDDGSNDESVDMIKKFFRSWPDCQLILASGPGRGYAANFLSMIPLVPNDADFLALSDQDDVWFEGKIQRAVKALDIRAAQPRLYGAATWVWDASSGNRRLFSRDNLKLEFRHAVAQNFAGGNTMCVNRSALDILRAAVHTSSDIPVHDWWIYQIITGAGGKVTYDGTPVMLYRQHVSNVIGANDDTSARFKRGSAMLLGTYRTWNDTNFSSLRAASHLLTDENNRILKEILTLRDGTPMNRLTIFWKGWAKRHGFIGQAGLLASLILNKF